MYRYYRNSRRIKAFFSIGNATHQCGVGESLNQQDGLCEYCLAQSPSNGYVHPTLDLVFRNDSMQSSGNAKSVGGRHLCRGKVTLSLTPPEASELLEVLRINEVRAVCC